MKERYQIEQQRAVQQFRRLATEQNPNIQMILPMADIVGLLQEGVGNLLRHAGLELMHLVMDEEVKSLAGERHQQHEQRRAHRWGKEDGYCVVDGQMTPIDKASTARSIYFRVAFPGSWTRRSAQLGGSGFNGTIPNLAGGPDSPLGRGFATYGSDSGHQEGAGRGAPPDPASQDTASCLLNPENPQ